MIKKGLLICLCLLCLCGCSNNKTDKEKIDIKEEKLLHVRCYHNDETGYIRHDIYYDKEYSIAKVTISDQITYESEEEAIYYESKQKEYCDSVTDEVTECKYKRNNSELKTVVTTNKINTSYQDKIKELKLNGFNCEE